MVLSRLLAARFGELSPAIVTRINDATAQEVEGWVERVLVARSLAEVLGDA